MGRQTLDQHGQPILTDKKCQHGVLSDDRGNNACEQCLEVGRTDSYLLGIAVGWEQVFAEFSKRAGEEYARGSDDKAKLYRDIAKDAKKISEERRADQKRHAREYGTAPAAEGEDPFAEADETEKY